MKLLFLGDTHGQTDWVKRVIEGAATIGIDRIYQLGDFGIWPGSGGVKFRDKVSKYARTYEIPFYWLDGNHEEFPRIFKMMQTASVNTEGVLHGDGFYELMPGVFYMPRGTVFEIDGITFGVMGGAVSIDKEHRLLSEKSTGTKVWWEEEQITLDDINKARGFDGTVDVMLSHDTFINPVSSTGWYKNDPETDRHRQKVLDVVKAWQPTVNVHGHYHVRHTTHTRRAMVVGLGMDYDPQSTLVVDTANGLDDFSNGKSLAWHVRKGVPVEPPEVDDDF